MKIQPTNQVTFGLNRQTQIRYVTPEVRKVIDTVRLSNRKQVIVSKEYYRGNLSSKLQYLKDAAGEWVKSKLVYYSGNKPAKVIKSEKEM